MLQEKETRTSPGYPVYRYNGAYTANEFVRVREFMHSDFPKVIMEANRGMRFTVEYPPSDICGPNTWNYYLDKILKPEINDLHPNFRKKPVIVRFVPTLNDVGDGTQAGATGNVRDDEYLVRIAYQSSKGGYKNPDELLILLMHEIAERDFWLKTLKSDKEAHVSSATEYKHFVNTDSTNYRNLLDEKIANRRGLRAIRRVFTEATLTYPYEEDK